MMTDHMKLNSMRDAGTWAQNIAGGSRTDSQIDALASWIWENKPEIGCCYADHPIYDLDGDDYDAIFGEEDDGEDE